MEKIDRLEQTAIFLKTFLSHIKHQLKMSLVKITVVDKTSCWREDRDQLVGETFNNEKDRYYPQSAKAKSFAAKHGVEYFVFVGTVVIESV